MRHAFAWIALLVGAVACVYGEPQRSSEVSRDHARSDEEPPLVAVLVVLDGVRWQEVFRGVDAALARRQRLDASRWATPQRLMPNLHWLMESKGAVVGAPGAGAPMLATGPAFISVPGYEEIFTGGPPTCKDNECRRPGGTTLLDELAAAPDATLTDQAVIASWSGIGRVAARFPQRIALSAGRRGGGTRYVLLQDSVIASLAQRADAAGPFPGHGDFRQDRYTAAIALRYLDLHRPRFLFIGLGEPDEYGHRNDYRRYLESLEFSDQVIGELLMRLGLLELAHYRTFLAITTDHGRAKNFTDHGKQHPESARVWLVVTGSEVTARGRLPSTSSHFLRDIAPVFRRLAPNDHPAREDSEPALLALLGGAGAELELGRGTSEAMWLRAASQGKTLP